MDHKTYSEKLLLTPEDNVRLANLCGQCDENIQLIENRLNVEIHNRGQLFTITGKQAAVTAAINVLKQLHLQTVNQQPVELHDVHITLRSEKKKVPPTEITSNQQEVILYTKAGAIQGRTKNQQLYLKNIFSHTVNFGIGPAGTGKTYLAVACAIDALEKDLVKRLVLVRPAVEAGERLGFLPGDLTQKVDPYLRPIYDALYTMLGFDRVGRLIEKNIIEIAPLAYMRGRTLSDAYIILDEAQNTTVEQMKMFLTRIGFGSKAVITGDVTQIDLLKNQRSGLKHVIHLLRDIEDISFMFFDVTDVIRHPIVQSIIHAYENEEKQ
ncbi:MAG: phosphate starvation-inducible protein PhoH [Gammaproteobacteria bacterium RIFCSPHIGHO2_12_FULL_35_23]|nr:MAG: phosphate starvation-inducible protein PhoH [Gammaproteobacteria bacterium RIFCSPHIGHO2_12_FULL_35_23]